MIEMSQGKKTDYNCLLKQQQTQTPPYAF